MGAALLHRTCPEQAGILASGPPGWASMHEASCRPEGELGVLDNARGDGRHSH